MGLSTDLIKEFVKITNDTAQPTDTEKTVYATVKKDGETTRVRIDGSEQLTPVSTTIDVADGDRVTVLIKNHTATITGNISSPAARQVVVQGYGDQIDAAVANIGDLTANNAVINGKLEANEAVVETLRADIANIDAVSTKDLEAVNAKIYNLETTYATVEQLNAVNARIDNLDVGDLTADFVKTKDFEAAVARIDVLETNQLTIGQLDAKYATVVNLDAAVGRIRTLESTQITTDYLSANYATISALNASELKVTNYIDTVEINGNRITAGTLTVDRLIVRGSENSIVYELNNITGALQAKSVDTLNGEIITPRTINADKVIAGSITTTELNVDKIFGNEAVINKIVAQDAFINAISTNSIVVGASNVAASAQAIANTANGKANDAITAANSALSSAQNTCPFISGTQTAATGTWTGVAPFSKLKDGQQITYWLPYNGSGNATLTLTLSNGTSTGAIPCYYNGTNRLTTHYVAGNVIRFTYRVNANISGTSYTGWWADANYDTNTYDRTRYNAYIYAASDIAAGNIVVAGSNGRHQHLKTGAAFDINKPILYANKAISASSTGTDNYLAIGFTITTTQSMTLTRYMAVYIKGTLNGSTFTPVSTTPLTQTVPTSEDGYCYILLGTAYTSTTMYLLPEHPIFKYINGSFQQIGAGATSVFESWRTPGTTTIDGGKITAESITADQIDVASLTAHSAFIDAISTNSIVVGASNAAEAAQSAASGAHGAAMQAQSMANSAASLARSAESSAGTAYGLAYDIQDNIYVSGTTEINGGKIKTGTIDANKIKANSLTATQINVANLFSQNITATGSISGLTLNAATLNLVSASGMGDTHLTVSNSDSTWFTEHYPQGIVMYSDEEQEGFGTEHVLIRASKDPELCFVRLYDGDDQMTRMYPNKITFSTTDIVFGEYRTSNKYLYIGTGTSARMYIGDAKNTARIGVRSAGRIDLCPGGQDTNGYSVSLLLDGQVSVFRPTTNKATYLGNGDYRFYTAYLAAAVNVSSDKRLKDNIKDLDDRYLRLADLLSTKSYSIIDDMDKRKHVGFIAQDVEAIMASVGLSEDECAFFNRNWVNRKDYTGYELSLVYEELHTIQIASLQKQVRELQNRVAIAEAQLEHYQTQQLGS